MKKLIIILMICAGKMLHAQPTVVASDKPGWHKIGETVVNFKSEKDNIVILGKDRFKAIKFKVKDAAIDLQDLEVYYEKEPAKNDKDAKVDVDMKGEDKGVHVNNSKDKNAKVDVDMKGN